MIDELGVSKKKKKKEEDTVYVCFVTGLLYSFGKSDSSNEMIYFLMFKIEMIQVSKGHHL